MARSGTERRREAEAIWRAGVAAVDPRRLVRRQVSLRGGLLRLGDVEIPTDRVARLIVVGAGKAGAAMAAAVEESLGTRGAERLGLEGLVAVPAGTLLPTRRIELHVARESHENLPTEAGVAGARRILGLVEQAGPRDVVLALVSGGGSALLPLPAEGIDLEDKIETTRLLHGAGATIVEANAVRRHLSAVKGGRLAAAFRGLKLVTLVLSDVVGDPLDAIASGPTAPDASTFDDALATLRRHGLASRVPRAVRSLLERGARGDIAETPRRLPPRVVNLVIGNGRVALDAMAKEARRGGRRVVDLGAAIEGETREVARVFAGILRSILRDGRPGAAPLALLSGGETTVTLGREHGLGGRNQEAALALLADLDEAEFARLTWLSAGSDGEDGPTDAAGAFADLAARRALRRLGAAADESLERHDAHPLLDRLGALFRPGPTGTNVMDLRVGLVDPP